MNKIEGKDMTCVSNTRNTTCVINNREIWFHIICMIESSHWSTISLICKTANQALKIFLVSKFGTVNTWASNCSQLIHKWKCRVGKNGPFQYVPPLMNYFPCGPNHNPNQRILDYLEENYVSVYYECEEFNSEFQSRDDEDCENEN